MNRSEDDRMTDKAEESKKRSFWRRPSCLLAGFGFIVVILLVAILGIAYYLPEYIQNNVLPDLGRQLPFESFSANIRRTGILGADIGNLSLGTANKCAIRAASVRIDYSPSELIFSKTIHVKRLYISGVVINIDLTSGKPVLTGYKPVTTTPEKASGSSDSGYRIKLDRMELQNGTCIVKTVKGTFRVPFNISVKPVGGDISNIKAEGKLRVLNNPVAFKAVLQPGRNNLNLDVNADVLLERLEELLPAGVMLDGRAGVKFKLAGRWSPLEISQVEGECSFNDLTAHYNGIAISNTGFESVFALSGGGNDFQTALSGITIDAGVPVELRSFDNKIKISKNGVKVDTVIECLIDKLPEGFELAKAVKLNAALSSSCNFSGVWSVKSSGDGTLISGMNVKSDTISLATGPVKWLFQASNSKSSTLGDAIIRIDSVLGDISGTHVSLPEVAIRSLFKPESLIGKMSFSNGSAINKKVKFKFAGISADIPVRFPLDKRGSKGRIKIADIIWKNNSLGKFDSDVLISKEHAALDGCFDCSLLPGLKVALKSTYAGRTLSCSAGIDEYNLGDNFDPGKISPDLGGVKISGLLNANARLSLHNGHIGSSGKISLEKAVITGEKQALSCENINLNLDLTNLLKLKSAPDQKLTFKTLRIGTIDIYDGTVDFQIESPEAMLLEKSSFGWCGGHLYTHALRIYTDKKSYRATIFCDGIVLSKMLNELGVAKASGAGEVMGRIPLVYDERGLTFDSGFLFSAPGQGNKLCLLDSDKLLAGIPKDTAQFAQLDIASEALRDFDYQWVKINLETKQDMLKVKMQIDGKPADLLPFKYDKQKGYFVRIKGKGAKFQGIKLDVNTSVPLNRLLFFNSKLQSMIGGDRK